MNQDTEQICTRKRAIINGENYYLVVGDDFVEATVPRENDPAMSEARVIVESLCSAITRVMRSRNKTDFGTISFNFNLQQYEKIVSRFPGHGRGRKCFLCEYPFEDGQKVTLLSSENCSRIYCQDCTKHMEKI